MKIALLVALASMNVLLALFLNVQSILSILKFVLTAALVLMFAQAALFLQVHNLQSEKQENKVPDICRRYWELYF